MHLRLDWVRPSGVTLDRQQEHKGHMSKSDEDRLMSEFFSARRRERSEEMELLMQDRLEEHRPLHDKEFVGGSVLDSLNFAKHDQKAVPPTTPSGTITEAMLAKVTSKDSAKQLAKRADAAAKMLGGFGEGLHC